VKSLERVCKGLVWKKSLMISNRSVKIKGGVWELIFNLLYMSLLHNRGPKMVNNIDNIMLKTRGQVLSNSLKMM
jgi:hypothetical protein